MQWSAEIDADESILELGEVYQVITDSGLLGKMILTSAETQGEGEELTKYEGFGIGQLVAAQELKQTD